MAAKRGRGEARAAKIRKAATALFLAKGYESVTLDEIVRVAGGSKSTVYSEFGSKSDLFVSIVETLCREVNDSLGELSFDNLDLRQSLELLGFQIMRLISVRRAYELHRLAVGESGRLPRVGRAWYTYGPVRTTAHIRNLLEKHDDELPQYELRLDQLAAALHDSFVGSTLGMLISGISKPASDEMLRKRAEGIVALFLRGDRK